MNLVEAIRTAAQKPKDDPGFTAINTSANSGDPVAKQPLPPSPAPSSIAEESHDDMRSVRFECFLTQQQIGDLLHWLSQNLRSVMTLREAAHYLRLKSAKVQVLAERGDLPAFRVDGRWRFLKSSLDDWMTAQHATQLQTEEGDETHAA